MLDIEGNLFAQNVDAICITTNGFVKKDGRCVAGRGCAKEARDRWPDFDLDLGTSIHKYGNVPSLIIKSLESDVTYDVLSFPVKPEYGYCNLDGSNVVKHMRNRFKTAYRDSRNRIIRGDRVPGWATTAQLPLIIDSAKKLVELADRLNYKKVVIPRPGCGAGELSWETVQPELNKILDNRFHSITFKK